MITFTSKISKSRLSYCFKWINQYDCFKDVTYRHFSTKIVFCLDSKKLYRTLRLMVSKFALLSFSI